MRCASTRRLSNGDGRCSHGTHGSRSKRLSSMCHLRRAPISCSSVPTPETPLPSERFFIHEAVEGFQGNPAASTCWQEQVNKKSSYVSERNPVLEPQTRHQAQARKARRKTQAYFSVWNSEVVSLTLGFLKAASLASMHAWTWASAAVKAEMKRYYGNSATYMKS